MPPTDEEAQGVEEAMLQKFSKARVFQFPKSKLESLKPECLKIWKMVSPRTGPPGALGARWLCRLLLAAPFIVMGLEHAFKFKIVAESLVDPLKLLGVLKHEDEWPSACVFLFMSLALQLVGGAALALGLERVGVGLLSAFLVIATAVVHVPELYKKEGIRTGKINTTQLAAIVKNLAILGGLLLLVDTGTPPPPPPRDQRREELRRGGRRGNSDTGSGSSGSRTGSGSGGVAAGGNRAAVDRELYRNARRRQDTARRQDEVESAVRERVRQRQKQEMLRRQPDNNGA